MKIMQIDMVYLWCDGNDPQFIRRKNKALGVENIKDADSVGDVRFYDNEEFRFSLRSLEKNIPWIHHIYIVTDRQKPYWLKESEKLTVIDHSQIMPQSLIPCFNSSVIEKYIHLIPNLSEHFLYSNDDFFFNQPLSPNFFFHEGKPILRVYQKKKYQSQTVLSGALDAGLWFNSIFRAWRLLSEYHHQFHAYFPHHNVDAYTKSSYHTTWSRFGSYLEKSNSTFRNNTDIERIIFDLDAAYSGNSILKILPNIPPWRKQLATTFPYIFSMHVDSTFEDDDLKHRKRILALHPKLFCLNSSNTISISEKQSARHFLEDIFSIPSSFEK